MKKICSCIVILAGCFTCASGQVEIKKNANNDPIIELKSIGLNTFVGDSAGYNTNNSGINNTSLGYQTLRNNLFGQNNVAIGSGALYNNTNGHQNSAVGRSALYSNTSGSWNTGIGYNSLYNNTTGFNNIAIGPFALEANTTSFSNIALGTNALKSNTQGNNNAAMGIQALYSNTTGVQNIAIGNSALYTSTQGSKNTVVGITAMFDNTTGSENTVHGFDALRKNTTGKKNTVVGVNALKNNTTGNYNVAIGDSSLISNVSGQNNTAIGSRANAADGLNNSTAIGSRASVTTSNSIVLGAIAGVNGAPSNTNIGIGTTAPNQKAILEVTSTTQGVLIPRMTTSQRKSISSPPAGLMVYDLDKQTIYLYDGMKWNPMMFTTNEGKLPLFPGQADDGLADDEFGTSVSLFGDYAIIGAPFKDVNSNTNQGGAYVFFRSGGIWSQQAILTASDGGAGDGFGSGVAMGTNGETVIIGCPGATINGNSEQGCAYIFVRNSPTWTQQAKLTASDGAPSDHFGASVALDGDYAVVGAPVDEVSFSNRGSAYVFNKGAAWYDHQPYQAKLLASDGGENHFFGSDVSISGDYVVCGAPFYSNTALWAGAVYIYNRSGSSWSQLAKIVAVLPGLLLGHSVSIDGDYIAVGAPGANQEGLVLILFRGSGWTDNHPIQASFSSPDIMQDDFFGADVAISGDYLVASSPSTNNARGASYMYKRTGTTWNYIRRSDDENGQPNETFGASVSIHGYNCVNGIPGKNANKGEVQFGNIE